MWKCLKCGREFSKTDQPHYCAKAPETIDAYILMQDNSIQSRLNQIHAAIKKELPDAKEKISWGMPTYRKEHNIIHFAAHKNHIGLYPGPEAVTFFAARLKAAGYSFHKGSIQIPYAEELPLELISEIAAWCGEHGHNA